MPLPISTVIRVAIAFSALWTYALLPGGEDGQAAITERPRQAVLGPTRHEPIPIEDADAWLVPDRAPDEREKLLASMAEAHRRGDAARVLALAPRLASERDLGGYARLYQARAHFAQDNIRETRRLADALTRDASSPYLAEQARLLAAQAALKGFDPRAAIVHLDALMNGTPLAPERALLWLGRAHLAAGDRTAAAVALTRVHYEFPLTPEAATAGVELAALRGPDQPALEGASLQPALGRAEQLFTARRWSDARAGFEALRQAAGGDDRALVEVRLGQIDYHTGRHAQARAALAPYTRKGPRQAEARYFELLAMREAGQGEAFARGVRELVNAHRDSTWAADALDALGTYYIRANEDARAAQVFTEIFDRYPSSARAERAAWIAGWRAYRSREFGEAIRIFERAAADFPRANKRPDWLYWAARARGESGDRAAATERHKLVLADYAHSYYGRQSARRLGVSPPKFEVARAANRRSTRSTEETAREAVPNGMVIHRLLRAGLHDEALGELRAAEKAWGTTPALQATIAWATREQGDLLRASVLMKRAYPQYVSRAGAALPDDVLRVTYPVAYWNLIRKYSTAHKLDPYLIAALIAQESGYNPSARSVANAWGLMQVVPATGAPYARRFGIRNYSARSLTDPETNIRIGTAFFADQVARLGSVDAALAAYNAGPTRARRWMAEKPGMERDVWIDDIPFPETQFYVKKILGTAEDYRALYSGGFDPSLHRTSPRPRGAAGGE
jgi:soluble lytic murein transglycosylase